VIVFVHPNVKNGVIATVLMVLWEALELGLDGQLNSGTCAAIIFLPVIVYIIICFKSSSGQGSKL